MLYSGRSFRGSALHHVQAHANSRPHSKYAPWAGDKGLGRNGIPKPAGAGGGSSSSSLAPDAGPTRLNNLEITPRRRPEGVSRPQSPRRPGAISSSKTSARRIASTSTTAPLSSRRKEGSPRPPGHLRSTMPRRLSFLPRSDQDRSRRHPGECKSPLRAIAGASAIQDGSFGKG